MRKTSTAPRQRKAVQGTGQSAALRGRANGPSGLETADRAVPPRETPRETVGFLGAARAGREGTIRGIFEKEHSLRGIFEKNPPETPKNFCEKGGAFVLRKR